jgi:hypothetical protein
MISRAYCSRIGSRPQTGRAFDRGELLEFVEDCWPLIWENPDV